MNMLYGNRRKLFKLIYKGYKSKKLINSDFFTQNPKNNLAELEEDITKLK